MLSGYKTYLAALASILTGLGMICSDLAAGNLHAVPQHWLIAVGGFAILGLGHKLEKLTAAMNQRYKEKAQ